MSVRSAVAAGPCCLLFRTSPLEFRENPCAWGFSRVLSVPVPAGPRCQRGRDPPEPPRRSRGGGAAGGADAELSLSPVILGDRAWPHSFGASVLGERRRTSQLSFLPAQLDDGAFLFCQESIQRNLCPSVWIQWFLAAFVSFLKLSRILLISIHSVFFYFCRFFFKECE